MSNHFTYEIDERNLRLQLKNLEVPLKEENWQKFDGFLKTNAMDITREQGGRFQFALNRNIVLPVAFGLVILLFSLLLFNFINIKTPEKSKVKEIAPANVIVTPPVIKQNEIPVNSVPQVMKEFKNNEAVKAEDVKIIKETDEAPKPNDLPPVKPEVATAVKQPEAIQKTTPTDSTANVEVVRKKRKKRAAEIRETERSIEIRPDLISEEQRPEIKP